MAQSPNRALNFNDPPEDFRRGKDHLLIIGIDEYEAVAQLENAVRDAKAVKQVLLDNFSFDPAWCTELYNEQASRRTVMKKLRELIDRAAEDDNVLVYFSGHGHYDIALEEGYWVPVDAEYQHIDEYIPYSFITKVLAGLKARHVSLIVDSCYSGAALVRERDLIVHRFERDPSRWILASGRNEVVPDGVAGKHSPFAKELIHFLEAYADKPLRFGTLCDKVITAVSYNSPQTPIARPLYQTGDKGGEYVFRPRTIGKFQADEDGKGKTQLASQIISPTKDNPVSSSDQESNIPQKATLNSQVRNLLIGVLGSIIAGIIIWQVIVQNASQNSPENNLMELEASLKSMKEAKANRDLTLMEGALFEMSQLPESQEKDEAIKKAQQWIMSYGDSINETYHMAWVEGGEYLMGDEKGRPDERPVHKVKVNDFMIAQFEVSCEEFAQFLLETQNDLSIRRNPNTKLEEVYKYSNVLYHERGGIGILNTNENKNSWSFKPINAQKYPVVMVSWYGAREYCAWLSEKTGLKFRLPTEAEWEYAAKSGKFKRDFRYAGSNELKEVAWTFNDTEVDSKENRMEVGLRKPNQLGLYDMTGNVLEWCSDNYDKNYYQFCLDQSITENPKGPVDSDRKVMRGGGWSAHEKDDFRISRRWLAKPHILWNDLGFRIVRELDPS